MARWFAAYVLPPLLWMAFIFPVGNRAFASSRIYEVFAAVFMALFPHASGQTLGVAYIIFRKTLHFIEYGFLAYLLYRAFRAGRGPHWSKRAGLLAAAGAVAYGFIDELLQSFVPNRTGSPYDWAVDSAGILAA
ncbi:MAG TPA: VanZ family protein, partial [Acidobacteriota bacterium]|nr:VanZ family protein [Acidobacteriota bacterium]